MTRTRKSSTDELLRESYELLSGVEEETDDVTARHDVEDLNGGGYRPKQSSTSVDVTAPGGIRVSIRNAPPLVLVSLAVLGVLVGAGFAGHWLGWW